MYGPNLKLFGITASGEKVFSIMLKNKDLACEIMTYGATVHTLFVPRSDGGMVDVVLGYDTLCCWTRKIKVLQLVTMLPKTLCKRAL